ncbi:5-formyltetrahydrofolate cyclo-ligase [Luminiphilus syltensis NOR5-1B]|uniref:5-formyltetrahydrofolate cyclo-ligase n=1 Tax=Luminiphilus syltensis NOR5-1B TaxID=565045 RepID=B8KU53_9GAMM|nr:5-formyltetrahydrofolate cyclo-ligase [Luminiphilus syltensis]EED34991.1 5-formyltetrahydrofolate cyclo-ligase [Luminiphilus syltensis NOR5-1B]
MSALDDPLAEKASLRERMSARRRQVSSAQRTDCSIAISNAIIELEEFRDATTVAAYLPLPGEIDPMPTLCHAADCGKETAVPRVISAGVMELRAWRPGEATEVGRGHVRQPTASSRSARIDARTLIIVPLLACDSEGIRLGFGGGFYDRLLAGSAGFRVGVGYSWQQVSRCPREAHDIPLHGLVTENGFFRF